MPISKSPDALFKNDSSRWAALQSRNPQATSSFVYCVTSTQICCRPTCKARLARRSNVLFHDTYADAVAAGFRACKRCRPELAVELDAQVQVVERARRVIEDAESEGGGRGGLRLQDLAAGVGLTKSHFHRVFKRVMGVTPRTYAVQVRAGRRCGDGLRAAEATTASTPDLASSAALSIQGSDEAVTPSELGAGVLPVNDLDFMALEHQGLGSDVGYELGECYLHPGFAVATKGNGVPTKEIQYTIQPWALGFVLIAATRDGVCWLEAGHSLAELSLSLAREFPLADLKISGWDANAESGHLRNEECGMFATVMEALERPTGKVFDVPFDVS